MEFLFCNGRINQSKQAIAMSNRRIKHSKVSITFKIHDQEFLHNWNSGIPEKEKKRGKKRAMSPFKALHGNTLQRGPQEGKNPSTSLYLVYQ
jgi:hypothetical protein